MSIREKSVGYVAVVLLAVFCWVLWDSGYQPPPVEPCQAAYNRGFAVGLPISVPIAVMYGEQARAECEAAK